MKSKSTVARSTRTRHHLLRGSALALSLALGGLMTSATAEDIARNYTVQLTPQDANIARHLNVGVGKSVIVELPRDASEIFVGNPAIANAVVRSARRLYVIAATTGQTTIFAMDKDGQRIASLELVVGRDMDELRRILSTAIPENDIHVSTVNDTVILTGTVASASEAQKAADIANAFVGYTALGGSSSGSSGGSSINIGGTQVVNGKLINSLVIRGKDQVSLRVTVAEVQRNVMKQLGVSAGYNRGKSVFSLVDTPSMSTQPGAIGGAGAGNAFQGNFGSFSLNIQALEKNGVAHVLAEPTVTAISGESAKFTAGGQVPITSSSSIDPKTGVCTVSNALQDYGVTLNFTPTVLSEGRISLHLATEVTEIDGTNSVQYACSNSIGFRTRKNETTVELPSGGSIVSAGLIQQQSRFDHQYL